MAKIKIKRLKKILLIAALVAMLLLLMVLAGCGGGVRPQILSAEELAAAEELLPEESGELVDVTVEALGEGRHDKFPGVKKVFVAKNGDYVIVARAIGYSGPVSVLSAINSGSDESYGIRILNHYETAHYVRDFDTAAWFVGRFAQKTVETLFYSVHFEAKRDAEIVAITGSTQTTDAVILAVNASFSLYREYVLGESADPVPDATDSSNYVEIYL